VHFCGAAGIGYGAQDFTHRAGNNPMRRLKVENEFRPGRFISINRHKHSDFFMKKITKKTL